MPGTICPIFARPMLHPIIRNIGWIVPLSSPPLPKRSRPVQLFESGTKRRIVQPAGHQGPISKAGDAEPGIVRRRPIPRSGGVSEPSVRVVSLDDAELVRQVQAGRTEAYGTLVRKYQDRVFNACWRIAGHLEDA